ncbi:hypothetical protein [Streptomyces kanamyceticus]|uniref:Secreted protein n=1 Tax=Streptomyces kanamyceticus TaxID=1967 RepID=A0A5J6GQS7_STRKN|nr:hypothetical protein [Streptomyces kanamyceticus]QEU96724.1 hypothetical protein CP970_42465 [Streptomyces kanamyceticus]
MPKPIRMSRRTWIATWAVLCAAGLAATVQLNASSEPDPEPEKPLSAECAKYIADIEARMAKAKKEGEGDGVLAFSRIRTGSENDCGDELRDHFGGGG